MKLIIANWKANKNLINAKVWLDEFKTKAGQIDFSTKEVVVTPPFNLLDLVKRELPEGAKLGVQDIGVFPSGNYTGEVSVYNLEGLDVSYAIVGHSERRRYQKETDLDVANKVERCLEGGITPIVCVDEPYLISQARAIENESLRECIVAYEPLSAIGTGDEMSPAKVTAVMAEIRKYFGNEVRIIYGGSVKGDNVKNYLEICDGVLVGGASLEAREFLKLM